LGQLGRIRAFDHALLGYDHVDQIGRGHVEDRIVGVDLGADTLPAHFE
jgi:hypothetical protein